jgi:hypothetical protein
MKKAIKKKIFRYKLTNEHMQTFGLTQWTLGEWKETDGRGNLCGPGWLHCYSSPLLAAFLNTMHADFRKPRLFKCEVFGKSRGDRGLKEGWSKMRLVKELEFKRPTAEQYAKFGILCALEANTSPDFALWAKNWLSGANRDKASAKAVYINVSNTSSYYAGRCTCQDDISCAAADAASAACYSTETGEVDLVKIAKKAME